MGAARMAPVRDERGLLRPDLDFREVPATVMATYLGVGRWCLWNRTLKGAYHGKTTRHGSVTYYLPRKIVGVA